MNLYIFFKYQSRQKLIFDLAIYVVKDRSIAATKNNKGDLQNHFWSGSWKSYMRLCSGLLAILYSLLSIAKRYRLQPSESCDHHDLSQCVTVAILTGQPSETVAREIALREFTAVLTIM